MALPMRVACVCLLAAVSAASARPDPLDCLFATTRGPNSTPIVPCDGNDSSGIGNDRDVKKVMAAYGIPLQEVNFKGCSHIKFSASEDPSPGRRRYVIAYPLEIGDKYLAPVTHELAHVLQMMSAGGFDALKRKMESMDAEVGLPISATRATLRIELGADYLAGLIFKTRLQDQSLDDFANNLALVGSYSPSDINDHGTPAQRTAAFRLGVFEQAKDVESDFRYAADYFQANHYGAVADD